MVHRCLGIPPASSPDLCLDASRRSAGGAGPGEKSQVGCLRGLVLWKWVIRAPPATTLHCLGGAGLAPEVAAPGPSDRTADNFGFGPGQTAPCEGLSSRPAD